MFIVQVRSSVGLWGLGCGLGLVLVCFFFFAVRYLLYKQAVALLVEKVVLNLQ